MRAIAVVLTVVCFAACGVPAARSQPPSPIATPSASAAAGAGTSAPQCSAPAQPMIELTEGPYYKAGAPERASLLTAGVAGTPLVLTGFVVTRSCMPLAAAKLDFWQADGNGNYDNSGYALRGWQLSTAGGAYRLETVIPGLYPGRTEHIHVKVTPSGGRTYTSQLFFPGVSQNTSDSIFSQTMLVKLDTSSSRAAATFTFVVDLP